MVIKNKIASTACTEKLDIVNNSSTVRDTLPYSDIVVNSVHTTTNDIHLFHDEVLHVEEFLLGGLQADARGGHEQRLHI